MMPPHRFVSPGTRSMFSMLSSVSRNFLSTPAFSHAPRLITCPVRYLSVPLFAKYQQTSPYASASSVFNSCSRASTLRALALFLGLSQSDHFLRVPGRSSLNVPISALIGKPAEPLQGMTGSAVRWATSDGSAALGFQVDGLGNLHGNRPSMQLLGCPLAMASRVEPVLRRSVAGWTWSAVRCRYCGSRPRRVLTDPQRLAATSGVLVRRL